MQAVILSGKFANRWRFNGKKNRRFVCPRRGQPELSRYASWQRTIIYF